MQAIILAAGMGKRLKELTKNNTKCMVKVNGVTLIERLLRQLDKRNLTQIIIVIGYEGEKLKDYVGTLNIHTPVRYINNPIYDKTNNIYSLSLAKEYLCKQDTLLFESDLIFEDSIIDMLINDPRETLALVDKYESWMDGTCVTICEDDSIEKFVPGKKFNYNEISKYYKTVNIYKFSKKFSQTHYVPFLEAYTKALGNNEYYEQVLRVITMLDEPVIQAKRLEGQLWYEIDDIQDLDIATSMFAPYPEKKVELLQQRYGGYWRYPQLIDFCYLVNPYFPPVRMIDEIKESFGKLLVQYPSGMSVNSMLAGRNFGIHQENIVVGNGAAELIKSLMMKINGKTGFVRPTFEEYPNRYCKNEQEIFIPTNKDFSYDVNDLIVFFEGKDIQNLILINPDNPSGNYIPKKDLLELISWSKEKNISLVIDESFVDFADEIDSSLIEQEIIDNNKHLYIMKSISKSYGVPGLRLGVLVSGNKEMISMIKKDVSIWNINSFAEFYMQIEEKYKNEYKIALEKIRNERKRFVNELKRIDGIRVIPSQANYIMIELKNGCTATEFTQLMLTKYNLLVKDLSGKLSGKSYIRLAVRNSKDNDVMIDALKNEFKR